MKTKSIEWWNSLPKNEDTDVTAIEGDIVVLISGIAFLIQRQNDGNNVVCWKVKTTRKDLVSIFSTFRAFCQKNDIQYFRVEGISHTYRMLYLVCRLGRKNGADCDVRYHATESAEYDRHIYYVKAY